MDSLDLALPSLSGPFGRQRSELTKPLAPADQRSMRERLLGAGQGALSYALGSLDKPGRAVRGVLAGKFHEGLAALPFSDSLHITDPDNQTTGRQLLDHYGITGKHDKGWGAWGAGLAADVVTDPLTYSTFGARHALTAGGQALERGGHLAGMGRRALLEGYHGTEAGLLGAGHTLDHIAHLRDAGQRIASPAAEAAHLASGSPLRPNQPLSGLARFSVPFAPQAGITVGSGGVGRAVAGALDRTGDYLRFGNPVGRTIGSHFDTSVNRATDEISQRAWSQHGTPQRQQLQQQARLHHIDVNSQLDQLIRANPADEIPILRAAVINSERSSPLAYLDAGHPSRYLRDTAPVGEHVARFGADTLAADRRAGLTTNDAADEFVRYVPRQATAAGLAGQQLERSTILPTTSGSNLHREELFRNVPGGRDRINDWADRFAGHTDIPGSASHILDDLERDHLAVALPDLTPAQQAAYAERATELSGYFAGLPRERYAGQLATHPFYQHSLSADVLRRANQSARTQSSATAAVSALSQAARPITGFAAGGAVPLDQALQRLGLTNYDTGAELVGAGQRMHRALSPHGVGEVTPHVTGGTPYGINDQLRMWGVPDADLNALSRQHANWIAPEESKSTIGLFDSATNAFKALAYPIWAASHVRNAATAALNNMRTGTGWQDYVRQFRLLRGSLPPAEAAALRRGEYGYANIFGGGGGALELQGTAAHARLPTARLAEDFEPGTNGFGMGRLGPTGNMAGDTAYLLGKEGVADLATGVYRKATDWRNQPNPLSMAGVGNNPVTGRLNDVDRFAPVVAGRKISGIIEDFFRGAQFNSVVRKGGTPEHAADLINRYHFDYSPEGLTKFERNVVRRALPFYRFSRGNLPLQLETLATRPAAFSTPFKPTQVDRDQDRYVPDYLAGGFAMPMGEEVQGKQRYLGSLGLPQEEALKELQLWNGRPDLATTAMRWAGNLNPLLKAPLEHVTGRQFYSGRQLKDLRPSGIGSGIASALSDDSYAGPITQALSNTPLTRFFTTFDKLADTQGLAAGGRKPGWATGLNLLTGARVTDVDVEKQRYLEQRSALNAMLDTSPNIATYSKHYVRPERREQLTPDELLKMRMLSDLTEQAQQYVQQQRRQR